MNRHQKFARILRFLNGNTHSQSYAYHSKGRKISVKYLPITLHLQLQELDEARPDHSRDKIDSRLS